MDLFKLAMLSIPFDNLFFAPSKGWATISPILFFIYGFFHIKKTLKGIGKESILVLFVLILVLYEIVLISINGAIPERLIDSVQTLVLGMSIYIAFIVRYSIERRDFDSDAKFLYKGYVVSFVYGICRVIVANIMPSMLKIFEMVEKRPHVRLSFSFTEPSFISMHVFGVMFLITYMIKEEKLRKKFIILGFLFLAVTIVCQSSARCAIDTAIFVILLYIYRTVIKHKHIVRNIITLLICIVIANILIMVSPRISKIISDGLYGDGSGASRLFYMKSAINAYIDNPAKAFFGYGIGNLHIPFKEGFAQTYSEMREKGAYVAEAVSLNKDTSVNSLLSMPIRMISDFGLGWTIICIFLLIKNAVKRIDIGILCMTLYLYIQFDSYAFYSLWLLIYFVRYCDRNSGCISYFEQLSG